MDIAEIYGIKSIADDVRFWMVRTKKGYFYKEFVTKGFVALGWNEILEGTDLSDEKTIKAHIHNTYKDKRPGLALNKCKNFISEIKENDILVIPSEGSKKITFAFVGDYYEDYAWTTEDELDITYKIDNKEVELNTIECPYIKRRKIDVIKTVNNIGLNYHLLSAISAYHGLCNFDEYGKYILDCIYDIYIYKNDISFSVNVTKKNAINPREVANLMYGLTEYLCLFVDENSLETAIYLNSPGKVKICLKKVADKFNKNKWVLLIALVILTGGSVKDAKLPGIVQVYKDFKTMNIYVQQQEANLEAQLWENELEKAEIEGKKIENAEEMLKLIEAAEEQGVDVKALFNNSQILLNVNESLELKSGEDFSVSVEETEYDNE